MSQKILIADDNELVRRLLRIMLEGQKGWQICAEAADGSEAITKAQESKPDAVILDFAMPQVDGLVAAREIARTLPSVPILLFTLYDSPEMALAAKEAGVSRVLPKTASGLPLIQAVRELLARGSEKRRSNGCSPT
ncbi:MAG: response regulator [Candidatus Acidiferrales bacterium]